MATAISLDLRHGVVVDGADQLIALPGLDQTLHETSLTHETKKLLVA